MSARFIVEGLRFFAVAILLGIVLLLAAPIDIVRVLCAFAIVCAAAGLALHVAALRATDPDAIAKMRMRCDAMLQRLLKTASRAFSAMGDATDTVWPGVLR